MCAGARAATERKAEGKGEGEEAAREAPKESREGAGGGGSPAAEGDILFALRVLIMLWC